MPRYKLETLVKTMIHDRCRRLRMGLRVDSAEHFADKITSLYARVRNAEKQPAPERIRNGLQVLRVSLHRETVLTRLGGRDVDRRTGRDVGAFGSYALPVAGDPYFNGILGSHLTLKVEHQTGGHSRGPQREQADNLRWYYLQCPQPAVDDVHPGEHGQDDEHRLTRARHRGRRDVAHQASA